jgi:hypothetical protein
MSFTWNEKEHRHHFPQLEENIALEKKREAAVRAEMVKRTAQMEEVKNKKTYGEEE